MIVLIVVLRYTGCASKFAINLKEKLTKLFFVFFISSNFEFHPLLKKFKELRKLYLGFTIRVLVVVVLNYLEPYCEPCHDRVYGSNSSMMEGSFSMESVRAHEQVIAEQRNTLIINMTRKRMPKAMHKYNNQGGLTPQSVHTDSTSANSMRKKN